MKAIMLVGGMGTRLRPLTYKTPKPLLPLCGVPHLKFQIAWLKKYGVTEITLSLGYLPTQFIECFENNEYLGVKINYVTEKELLGTAGAIKFASESLDLSNDETFLVCNGDILSEFDISELIDIHNKNHAYASIGLTEVEDPSKFGVVPTKENGEITAFVEKPSKESAPTTWINAGIYIFDKKMLDFIPSGVQCSVERDVFQRVLKSDGKMFAVKSDAYWMDIGTPEQFIDANCTILNNLDTFEYRDIILEGKTEISSGIWVGKDCQIDDSASLEATIVLGDNVKISANSTLKTCFLGDSAVVGENSNLENSFIGDNTTVSHDVTFSNSSVGFDSYIGHDCLIDSNTLVGSNVSVEPISKYSNERVD